MLFLGPLVGVFAWLAHSMQVSSDSDDAKTFFDFAPAVVSLGAGLVAFVGGPLAFFLDRLPGPRTTTTAVERCSGWPWRWSYRS